MMTGLDDVHKYLQREIDGLTLEAEKRELNSAEIGYRERLKAALDYVAIVKAFWEPEGTST